MFMQSNKFNVELSQILQDVKSLNDFDNIMNALYKQGFQEILKAEMTKHLGYEKHAPDGINTGNSRNGTYKKTVRTTQGAIELDIPRDRNGEFVPLVIPKGQTTTEKIESVIISLYSKGMSTEDITVQLEEIYGLNVSKSFISDITNKILPAIHEWQNRPITWFGSIVFVLRSGKTTRLSTRAFMSS